MAVKPQALPALHAVVQAMPVAQVKKAMGASLGAKWSEAGQWAPRVIKGSGGMGVSGTNSVYYVPREGTTGSILTFLKTIFNMKILEHQV